MIFLNWRQLLVKSFYFAKKLLTVIAIPVSGILFSSRYYPNYEVI